MNENTYDDAIAALAPYLPDGWVGQIHDGNTFHFEDGPNEKAPEVECHGGWYSWRPSPISANTHDGDASDFLEKFTLPRCPDWRTSLRRIGKGRVVQ